MTYKWCFFYGRTLRGPFRFALVHLSKKKFKNFLTKVEEKWGRPCSRDTFLFKNTWKKMVKKRCVKEHLEGIVFVLYNDKFLC